MVNINELRIDNWILWNPKLIHPNVIFEPMQVQVSAIMAEKIGYLSPNLEHRVEFFEDILLPAEIPYWPLEEFEPIVLTEEWLLKFEFNKQADNTVEWLSEERNGYRLILQEDFNFRLSSSKSIEIKYVHQLQNLYHALTGEEVQTQ